MSRSDRNPALPVAHRLLLCALLLTPLGVLAASGCATSSDALLTLTVSAGEAVMVEDRALTVRVYEDGCVALHRPAFYRDAGDFRLLLTAREVAELRAQRDALDGFDVARLRRDIGAKQALRRKDGAATEFVVSDADQFDLHWQHAGKRAAALWPGLHEYAEQYPEIKPLTRLSRTVSVLQSIAQRSDVERVAGAQP